MTEFKDTKTGEVDRTHPAIAINYLKGAFIIDFLAFFPFFELFRKNMLDDTDK